MRAETLERADAVLPQWPIVGRPLRVMPFPRLHGLERARRSVLPARAQLCESEVAGNPAAAPPSGLLAAFFGAERGTVSDHNVGAPAREPGVQTHPEAARSTHEISFTISCRSSSAQALLEDRAVRARCARALRGVLCGRAITPRAASALA